METWSLALATHGIEQAVKQAENNHKNSSYLARFCPNQSSCPACERLGIAKRTLLKTKVLLLEMVTELQHNSLPRTIFDRHLRRQYGNYSGYILPSGHYINLWGRMSHSSFTHECYERNSNTRNLIKVHGQAISHIILYDWSSEPTRDQIETLRDLIADSLLEGYQLGFRFAYDANHYDPRYCF